MRANSQLLAITPQTKNKSKLSKQLEQEQNQRNGDYIEGYQQGSGRGREGRKVQRISSINDRWKYVGNVEAKELISMTHGHEL